MISMTSEIRLVLLLVLKDEPVPDKLKANALEQLSLMIAEYQEGDAFWHLLDMLYQGIDNQDKDLLNKVADLGENMLKGNEDNKPDEEAREEIASISFAACRKFCEEKDTGPRVAITERMTSDHLFPIYYDNGFMLLYADPFEGLAAASINDSYDKNQLIEKVDTMPVDEKAKLFSLIHRAIGIDQAEIRFMRISYDQYANNQVYLKIQEL